MKILILLAAVVTATANAHGGDFINLGFDQPNTANIVTDSGLTYGTAADLVPGWTISNAQHVNFNNNAGTIMFTDLRATLYKTEDFSSVVRGFGSQPPDLSQLPAPYVLNLYPISLTSSPPPPIGPIFLMQSGTVPGNAGSLQFYCFGSQFGLQMNGTTVPLTYEVLASSQGGTLYRGIGNIAAFAGQSTEMKFTTTQIPGTSFYHMIDSIQFVAIPEPTTVSLVVLGAGALFFRKRFGRAVNKV